MSVSRTLIVSTIIATLFSASSYAFHVECRHIEKSIDAKKQKISDLMFERARVDREKSAVIKEFKSLESQITESRAALKISKEALTKLNNDLLIADEKILENESSVEKTEVVLAQAITKEKRLESEYNAIKESIWNIFKKRKALRKLSVQRDVVKKLKNDIQGYRSNIAYYISVRSDFNTLEAKAADKIELAENKYLQSLENISEINALKKEEKRLGKKSLALWHEEGRLSFSVQSEKRDLAQCIEDAEEND